jgi:hypothetical protein
VTSATVRVRRAAKRSGGALRAGATGAWPPVTAPGAAGVLVALEVIA